MAHSPKKPFVRNIRPRNNGSATYVPMDNLSSWEEEIEPVFKMPLDLPPTPNRLNELFLPDKLIDKIVTASNAYARKILPTGKVEIVSAEEILRFFAIHCCMGVV